jgi:hypothetical protein
MKFLIDRGFRKKLDYLYQNDPGSIVPIVQKFAKETLDPFFKQVRDKFERGYVQPSAVGGGGMIGGAEGLDATEREELKMKYEKALNKIDATQEKLYAVYNNKLGLMDLILNETFYMVYFLKVFRVLFIWFSLYLASKVFQEQYVTKVFANNEDPPKLMNFILIFWGLETIFMAFLFILLFLMKYLFNNSGDSFIINNDLIGKFITDYVVSTVFIISLGLILASVMMKKKYFKYKSDGLRAIRGLQEIMLYVSIVVLVIPFFVIL